MKKLNILFFALCILVSLSDIHAQAVKGNGINLLLSQQACKDKAQSSALADRFCIYPMNDKEYISLILKVKDAEDLSFLNKYDAQVGSVQGKILTLRIDVNQVEALCNEKQILEIETSRKVATPLLNNALKDLKAYDVQQGVDLLQSYTGRNVLIGIADWGLDYTHPTLYDTLMEEYRLLAVWDQFRQQGPAPEGFSYGTEIIGKDKLLEYKTDTSGYYDTGYHATHVLGITGGGGAGTKYRGLAIDANWIMSSLLIDEASAMDAFTWMKNFAKSQGKRLVINNSWGVYISGFMDGTSLLDEFINDMSDNDSVIFVVSAGNNGATPFHIKADFTDIDTIRTEVMFDNAGTSSPNYWGETITMQGEGNTTFSARLEFYNYAWTKVHETPWLNCDGNVITETQVDMNTEDGDNVQHNILTYRGSSRYPSTKSNLLDFEVAFTKPGNYHTVLVITANEGVVHGWNVARLSKAIGNWGYEFKATFDNYLQGDDQYGVSEPALAEKTIAVAAYRYKPGWTPTIASFSSRGPIMADYLKPDIAAPGQAITSAVNSYSVSSPNSNIIVNFNDRDYAFAALSGTSMSGPMVSGAVALMLEANPNLSSAQIKEILLQTARQDDYTEACPNETFGYGKMDVYEAVKRAEDLVSLTLVEQDRINIYPVPASTYLNINGVNADIKRVVVYDMMGQSLINTAFVNNQIDISCLQEGVYILALIGDLGTQKVKFIKK